MKQIYFMNNGPFDIRAMLTFGVSAKDNPNAIGFFGTGFKYAISIILRLGGSIKIDTFGDSFVFESKKEQIRNKEFNIVYVNSREAGFTTHLGINWKPWMAFRELYCNTTDENGKVSTEKEKFDTVITVECEEISKTFEKIDDYFLTSKPKHVCKRVEIHDVKRPYIYYKGVAIRDMKEGLYSYNIKSKVDLTEDRTSLYNFQLLDPIIEGIQGLEDKTTLKTILKSKKMFESDLYYSKEFEVSNQFLSVCNKLKNTEQGIPEAARMLLKSLDKKNGNWESFYPSKVQSMMMSKSIGFLDKIGVDVDLFPIKTVVGLGENVMGRAVNDTIYLSELPFQMGTKQLTSTILEEWVHNKLGCCDFDRKMQSWLFDKILSIAEEFNGEPL